MKLEREEYFELSYYQALAEKQQVSIESEEKEKELKTLKKRIHDLEMGVINQKVCVLKQKKRHFQDKVVEIRKQIGDRLGVDIDQYLLDDETLEVFHQDKIKKEL